MSLSESMTSTDGIRATRPKIIDFKIQRDPGLLKYNSYFFAKEPETTTTEKRVVSLLGRKVKSRDAHFDIYPTKKFRTLPYESTNKVVREIHLRRASNRRAIVQFKGYTSVPQSEKFIIRRNACHHNEMLKQRDLVQNYIKNNDFGDDIEINTDVSPIDTAEIKLFLPKNTKHINTQSYYGHKTNVIGRPIYFNPNPRSDNSAETEDQKEFIFVKIPRIDYENVDDKKSKKTIKKSIFKHYRLFKRDVIEEEHQVTTAASFKPPALDSELTSSLVFNNINT
ncbi:hypothetical protein RR46_01140 [Papilio xuthus]|uniref:Uncharacterized protein n=1 Tax=Papilio xuthus TaxID=66420 RepID=A0A0N1I5Q8_PAPXU|nr:hypothetical protein RR46_01140 [Papilio xuthus]